MKPLETSFERIETKYMVSKTDLQDLIEDLSRTTIRLRPFPISTLTQKIFSSSKTPCRISKRRKKSVCGPISHGQALTAPSF